MNRVKVSEATGPVLDWMVSKCLRGSHTIEVIAGHVYRKPRLKVQDGYWFQPSTNWSLGGPIIEREGILLRPLRRTGHTLDGQWLAMFDGENTGTIVQWVKRTDWHRHYWIGPTPLVAAMRCFVASKLGDDVEVPEELNHG